MSKVESFYTPIGTIKFPKTIINEVEYPYIFVPENIKAIVDNPENKGKVLGQWKFQIAVDPKEATAIIDMMDAEHGKIKNANFKPFKPDSTKNEQGKIVTTGLIAINFTSGFPPILIDAAKNDFEGKIGWGSKVRVKFSVKAVNNKGKIGLGRYAKAIQVIELKSPGADLSGFDAVESTEKSNEPWES